MIIQQMQEALIKQIRELFYNKVYLNEEAEDFEGIKIFSQDLPLESNREGEDEDPFPYIIVKIVDGTISDEEPYLVRVLILLGVFDEAKNRQGYQDLLHMINVIYNHFSQYRLLNDEFYVNGAINWTLQDEDTHPYYFGALELYINIPTMERSNDYT